jgi:hypothetical protein
MDRAASLLPHIELAAGAAEHFFASIAVDDGNTPAADLANFFRIRYSH